jgi:hypothetical protein
MSNKIKFGTQCDEAVLRAVKARLASEDGFLGDAVESGLRLWLSSKGDALLQEILSGTVLMKTPNASAHALIDELIATRPETAKNMLATIRALLKEERVEARTVPAINATGQQLIKKGAVK